MGLIDSLKEVKRAADEFEKSVHEELVQKLIASGEELVRIARSSRTYQDRTGNLTASIGYGVFLDRKMVAHGGFTNAVAAEKGLRVLETAGQRLSDGYVLVIVAGMEYAEYVESQGRVVLASAKAQSDNVLRKQLPK